jgi:hypothetical protein
VRYAFLQVAGKMIFAVITIDNQLLIKFPFPASAVFFPVFAGNFGVPADADATDEISARLHTPAEGRSPHFHFFMWITILLNPDHQSITTFLVTPF